MQGSIAERIPHMPVPVVAVEEAAAAAAREQGKERLLKGGGAPAPVVLPPLPKIYGEDKRVSHPEEYFRFTGRYQYMRLLGHGAYGMVW